MKILTGILILIVVFITGYAVGAVRHEAELAEVSIKLLQENTQLRNDVSELRSALSEANHGIGQVRAMLVLQKAPQKGIPQWAFSRAELEGELSELITRLEQAGGA